MGEVNNIKIKITDDPAQIHFVIKKTNEVMFAKEKYTLYTYPNTEDVSVHPGALLHDVFDRDSDAGDELAQLGDAAGPVAHRHLQPYHYIIGVGELISRCR